MIRLGAGSQPAEQGSGTVMALGIIAALLVVLTVVHALSAVAVAKGQSARAADLAALAGADTARGLNVGDPCTVAEHVVARNSSVMEDCTVGGDHPSEVRVSVSRSVRITVLPEHLNLPQMQAEATARAGPPEAQHR